MEITYRLYLKTLKIETLGRKSEHSIYLFWHNKIFALLEALKDKKGKVLISPSREGKIASKIVRSYGFEVIESSYRKERMKGAIEIVRTYKSGLSVGIVPDGPLGPRNKIKLELFNLLKKLSANITLVGVGYSKYIELNTWDKFQIPLPFSKVFVMFANYHIDKFNSVNELEEELNNINFWAQEIAKIL
ncbi:MAG: DUF374 domain-containing protein [candidate division WOR-3 bacterium]|nr:DUF374 domain-containing protein [candidate division WOR-3 bacterium]MDW8150390.1 DUF374 domain-containing protein [candidate division WOR-3 bacterium]